MRKIRVEVYASLAVLIAVLLTACASQRQAKGAAEETKKGKKVAPIFARKLASMAKFSPEGESKGIESPGGFADQDWLEKSTDGASNEPPDVSAFATARNDWRGLKARPAAGGGAWTPYGPTNALNDLNNAYRDRTVYIAGTQNFTGRTAHGVIAPDCDSDECNLWIANANGGVWRTHNALAEDDSSTAAYEGPSWEYVSETFESNSVSSLELDPNDSDHRTIWAGTGEPNACGSGCEVGVGVYVTRNGGTSWTGPHGAEHFFGRAVGSIEVKPGDSKTIFAASARAVRGISSTCCGGVDALIPGADHFGIWRSQDGGKNWEIVHQGAPALCTSSTPDQVSLNTTPCSARGARRVKIDPVDPNVVYASFFQKGIWRSKQNGDPGTWEQIRTPVGTSGTAERMEFDVVALPSGETRMYVGIGGGGVVAHFRRNDAVRNAPAATVQATWILLTNTTPDTPGYSSFGYCDGQCSYDNYVYVPPASSGATPDTVYLSGVNQYGEVRPGSGRSNGRAVVVSTDAGATFTDMTEDDQSSTHPGALHPDHHALVVNPQNWKQFFDFGDGGVVRSNGVFVNDAGDCTAPPHSFLVPSRIAFCQMVLSRVPQKLEAINNGLRTLHFYEIEYDKRNPEHLAGGTQDNGSWESIDKNTWLNVNVADGGHNAFDAVGPGSRPNFRLTGWQQGQLEVSNTPLDSVDVVWIADNLFVFYGGEATPFIAAANTDPVQPGWLWTAREHVFRSTNWGYNPLFPPAVIDVHCNVWFGDGDLNGDSVYTPTTDICDDWRPLGNPGTAGRLTNVAWGSDRTGGHVSNVERAHGDVSTLWATTSTGRVFITKNADDPNPAAVAFVRLDSLAANDPPRYPTAIFVDRNDPNRAWISYSGYNVKTPATPGHVFEVVYDPSAGTATFTNLDGNNAGGYGDIPANSIAVSSSGTIYVGNDYGVVQKQKSSSVWHLPAAGLPNVNVPDLVYVAERGALYAATHGQGVWKLDVH